MMSRLPLQNLLIILFLWLFSAYHIAVAQNLNSRLNVNPSADDGMVSGVEVNWQALQKLSPENSTKIPLKNFEDADIPSAISGLSSEYSRLLFPQSPTKTVLKKPASMRGTSPEQSASETAEPLDQKQIFQATKRNITADNSVERLRPENERLNNIGAAALRARISAPKANIPKTENNENKITLTPLPILPNNKAIDYFAHQEIKPFTPSPARVQKPIAESLLPNKQPKLKSANTQLVSRIDDNIKNGDINIVVPKPITKVKPTLKIAKATTPKPQENKKLSDMRGKINALLDKNITKKPSQKIIEKTTAKISPTPTLSSTKQISKATIPVLTPLKASLPEPSSSKRLPQSLAKAKNSNSTTKIHRNDNDHLSLNINAGVAKLSDDTIDSLKPIAQTILNNPNQYVIIRAYAGSDQSSLSAQKRLSLERALNTRNALKALGLKTNQVQVKPMGYVASEGNNDRIDIIIKSKS